MEESSQQVIIGLLGISGRNCQRKALTELQSTDFFPEFCSWEKISLSTQKLRQCFALTEFLPEIPKTPMITS